MFRLLIFLTLSLFFVSIEAQSSRIKKVVLQSTKENNVIVQWVMNPGSTCNSPQVQHSLDGERFKTVFIYPGVCGGSDEEKSYSWGHQNAVKYRVNYYRIRIDEGEVTEPEKIDLQSILVDRQLLAYPNPSSDILNIELRNESDAEFFFRIYDRSGKLQLETDWLKGSKQLINIDQFRTGLYFLEVEFEDGRKKETSLLVQ